jgi:hypothetical protein
MRRSCVAAALLCLALVAACRGNDSSGPGQSDGAVQGDGPQLDSSTGQQDGTTQQDAAVQHDSGFVEHSENNGGVMHAPGKNNPLVSCTACHGSDLKGGTGPSCYSCHNNNDHTISRGGHLHLSGSSSTCTACHGPSNTGGLGPSCNGSGCH